MEKRSSKGLVRNQIKEKHKWKLSDLYASVEDWKTDKERIKHKFKQIKKYRGSLRSSAQQLYKALEFYHKVEKDFLQLYAYASMLSDQNTLESIPLAMKQEITQIEAELRATSSFLEPEIISFSYKELRDFFKHYPKLQTYQQFIYEIKRRKKHTLDEKGETIIAEAGRMSDSAHEIYNILSNADLPYPSIKLSDGQAVRLDPTNYSLFRASKVRKDRKKVFNAFFETLNKFQRTFGTQLYSEIKKNIFYKNVRKYQSCLENALDRNNIPLTVYFKLIENVNRHLPILHRYLKLRKKMLNVSQLFYYDLYPSLVKEVDLNYNYKQAQDTIKKSLRILGKHYLNNLEKAFSQRWIDVYPNPGKRSGAYMNGIAYDVHPYILLNFKGKFNDLSTLTHELGHALHSYFSNKKQPYVNSHYPIFLAEVASTVNEALLIDYLLKKIKTKKHRLALLGNYLDGFRGTLFRQTQFAEFELKIHELSEKGEAFTGDRFTEIYLEILRKYHGHEEGITIIDDLYGIEWAYIPHFYYNFYVFQYSTSFTAAQAIVNKLLNREPAIINKYITFLSSGCSDYAIPTLQKMSIDMTTDEPFTLAMRRMNGIMDEMEEILDQK